MIKSKIAEKDQFLALSLVSLYVQDYGPLAFLNSLKESFPREYQALVQNISMDQVKKGYLLDARTSRRKPARVENDSATKPGPGRNKGNKRGAGRTQPEREGLGVAEQVDSKDLPVQNNLPG